MGLPCFDDPPPSRGSSSPVPGMTLPQPPLAVADCSVFFTTISPTASVPCITPRHSSLWCHRHCSKRNLRGPCSGDQMETGVRAGTIGSSVRPGARALLKKFLESMYSGECWTIFIKSQHVCWSYLPSSRKSNNFSLSDGFRPFSPSFGCCCCFKTLSFPASFCVRRSRIFFLNPRT